MAARPGDRYDSVRSLAADLEHWLADEPVAAYREPALARLARWGRRHRSLVAGTAMLLISALAALSAGLVLLGRANARTEQQRRLAEANFAEAQRQRDLARTNFQVARRAVDENFVQVSENTLLKSPLPGLQPLRKQLLESALKYYQQFLRLGGDDPAVRAELAQAYSRVGSITAEIGTPTEALASFEQARDLYQALAQADRQDASFRGDLARIHRGIGRMMAATGRPTEAVDSFRRAIALGEELVEGHPEVPESQHDLAWAYNNLGSMLHRGGQPAAGRRAYQQAISTWERLIGRHPRTEFRIGLGQAYSNLGWHLSLAGRLEEALEANRKAVVLSEEVVQQDGADPSYQSRLCQALDNLGTVCYFAGQLKRGRETFEKALAVAEPLTRANPAVVGYQQQVIVIHNDLGHLLLRAGRYAEARRSFEAALGRAKALPDIPPTHFNYSSIYRGLGRLQRQEGQFRAALETLQEAVRIGTTSPGEKPFSTYELACAQALCAAVAGEGRPDPPAEILAQRRRLADQAMDSLRQAVAGGWQNVAWMRIDPDLDPLRSRDDFKKLLDDLGRAQAAGR
jgi:serine/threonine-protein kinase